MSKCFVFVYDNTTPLRDSIRVCVDIAHPLKFWGKVQRRYCPAQAQDAKVTLHVFSSKSGGERDAPTHPSHTTEVGSYSKEAHPDDVLDLSEMADGDKYIVTEIRCL